MVRVCVRERERDSVCCCPDDAGLLYHRFMYVCARVCAGRVCVRKIERESERDVVCCTSPETQLLYHRCQCVC